jgi:hypothetical protein
MIRVPILINYTFAVITRIKTALISIQLSCDHFPLFLHLEMMGYKSLTLAFSKLISCLLEIG